MAPKASYDEAAENKARREEMANAFDNPQAFPDLTIICGNRSWLCHKMVLCQHSDWFQKACSGRFKEGGASTIEVQEDDSEAFGAMLRYCYAAEGVIESSELSLVVRLFALAEKYFVRGLPLYCGDEFDNLAGDCDDEELAQAISLTYSETSDPDRILKDRVVDFLLSNDDLLEGGNKEFDQLLATVAELGADLTKALVQQRRKEQESNNSIQTQRYRCPSGMCAQFSVDVKDDEPYRHGCPHGAVYVYSGKEWRTWFKVA